MKVLITGSDGFIAKNFILRLQEVPSVTNVITSSRADSQAELETKVTAADIIFHLAGVNRPSSEQSFQTDNIGLTTRICDLVAKHRTKTPIVFTSSTQAALDNPYGASKHAAEEALSRFGNTHSVPICIYRLPGVFGKWCKPNYNSVVATFCHNIANGLDISIDQHDAEIQLAYIDDVIDAFIERMETDWDGVIRADVSVSYRTTVGQLANKIRGFRDSRESRVTDAVGQGLTRALYSTYLTYLPSTSFTYQLPVNSDPRGDFVEFLKTEDSGQMSFFTCKPGVTRGRHYHHSKNEKFLIVKGRASFRFKNLENSETHEITVSDELPTVVETIPGWVHDITNIGREELIVMLWANEIFDPNNPDTYTEKVVK